MSHSTSTVSGCFRDWLDDALRGRRLVLRGMMRLDMGVSAKKKECGSRYLRGNELVSKSKTTGLLRMGLLLAGLMAAS
jgi:hypothetical protein